MKQTLILILTLTLIFPAYTFAQEIPKVTDVQKNQPAPFTGTLLNPSAAAQIIADKENAKAECKLQYEYIKEREKAKCDLAVNSAKVSLAATQKRYEAILKIKDNEINRLTKIATNNPNSYNSLYFSGGVIVGVGLSVLIFYAAVQIEK